MCRCVNWRQRYYTGRLATLPYLLDQCAIKLSTRHPALNTCSDRGKPFTDKVNGTIVGRRRQMFPGAM